MRPEEPEPAAIVRAYLEALNRGDADAAAALVSEDFVNEHTSTLGETIVGREAYRSRVRQFLHDFEGLHYEVEEMIAEGPRVAVAYRMSGTWRRPVTQDARPFRIRGMFRFRLADGRIAHRVDYWDSADFRRQVGAPEAR